MTLRRNFLTSLAASLLARSAAAQSKGAPALPSPGIGDWVLTHLALDSGESSGIHGFQSLAISSPPH